MLIVIKPKVKAPLGNLISNVFARNLYLSKIYIGEGSYLYRVMENCPFNIK